MRSKHTPAPWKVANFTGPGPCRRIVGPNQEQICEIYSGAMEADAHLIAAAPELLEAVKVAYSHHHSDVGNREYVKAVLLHAIAKAEGKGE